MIHRLSQMITDFLLQKKIISESESDIYTYGYETIILGLIDLGIVIAVGMIFKEIAAMLIFFTMFVTVRIYSGGYHANSVLKCKVIFTIICLAEVLLTQLKFPYYFYIIVMLLYIVSCVFLSPIENKNKPLTPEEQMKYRKISIVLSLIWTIAATILYFFVIKFCTVISLTAFCITLLMVIGKYRKEEKANEQE